MLCTNRLLKLQNKNIQIDQKYNIPKAQSQKEHHVLGPTGRMDDRRNESFQGVKIDIAPFNILKGQISSS